MHPLSNVLLYVWIWTTLWDLITATRIVRLDVCHSIRYAANGRNQEVLVQDKWYCIQGTKVDADGFEYISYFVHFGPGYDATHLLYDGLVIYACVYLVDRLVFASSFKHKQKNSLQQPKTIANDETPYVATPL
jgi:hypothetical protein